MRSNLILFVLVLVLVLVLVNQNFIGDDDEGGGCRAVAQRAKEAKTTDHGQATFSGEKL